MMARKAGEGEIDLEALRRGDKTAWDGFVARYAPVIHAAAARTLGGDAVHDTADVAQDVFLRLARDGFRLLKRYDPGRASLATWLTVIARNISIDILRRRRAPLAPLDERALAVAAPEPPPSPDIEIPAELLTPRQRLVLRLLFDEDLDPPEVAALLGVEVHTVRSTKHKAIARLRDHFHAQEESGAKQGPGAEGDVGGGSRVYEDKGES